MIGKYPEKAGVAILGGGITGLATAYFASREGLSVTVFEKKGRLGGNCITYRHGDFSFDSGAHRIHDKNPVVTELSRSLLGNDLLRIDIPSQVYDGGHLLKFPFSFRNLFFHLGPTNIIRTGLEILYENFARTKKQTFEHSAKRRYGSTVADRFLLNYTEKLWGLPCDQLSPELTGGRLKGLDMRRVMSEIIGMRSQRRDMEGAFYYPRMGIGTLAERFIAGAIGARFRIDSEVETVYSDGRRVTGVRTGNGEEIEVDHLISTIPLPSLLRALDPPIPDTIFTASQSLRYRNLILVALFIDKPFITQAATVYFPGREFPFTRIAEPRNRSSAMSPEGKTSLVAEIPYDSGDAWCDADDTTIVERMIDRISDIGLVPRSQITGSIVKRMQQAYPVISLDAKQALQLIEDYCDGFVNLSFIGRTGAYRYSWIHDHISDAKRVVSGILRSPEWINRKSIRAHVKEEHISITGGEAC